MNVRTLTVKSFSVSFIYVIAPFALSALSQQQQQQQHQQRQLQQQQQLINNIVSRDKYESKFFSVGQLITPRIGSFCQLVRQTVRDPSVDNLRIL